jgi:hypothetical protein
VATWQKVFIASAILVLVAGLALVVAMLISVGDADLDASSPNAEPQRQGPLD